jgi:cation diffusion facilitator family transporter
MAHDQTPSLRAVADREKRSVALSSLLAAVVLTTFKLAVGLWTNSLGILSEAAHSGLDLVAAGITFWAVRVSGLPADQRHTYGHGKFENVSALAETLLLLITCLGIVYESLRRLFFAEGLEVTANVWAFLVVIVSIAIDYSRSRTLRRAADKHHSQALEADALHFSTDIWSSLVVLFGLIGVRVSQGYGIAWLENADTVAALGVAMIVVIVSFRLGKKSLEDLLDAIPAELREQVIAVASEVPGVLTVELVRLRRSGPEVFADVTLTVDRSVALERAHGIANETEAAVRRVIPESDVVVHIEPTTAADEHLLTTIRVLAARHGLGAHGIRIYEDARRRSVELHLEVDEALSLEEAHHQATEFERALHETVPSLVRIVTHLEPTGHSSAVMPSEPSGKRQVQQAIADFLRANNVAARPHAVEVQRTGSELAVSFHCTLDADTAITDAHKLTEQLEQYLRGKLPNLGRVVIHVEPGEGSQMSPPSAD